MDVTLLTWWCCTCGSQSRILPHVLSSVLLEENKDFTAGDDLWCTLAAFGYPQAHVILSCNQLLLLLTRMFPKLFSGAY